MLKRFFDLELKEINPRVAYSYQGALYSPSVFNSFSASELLDIGVYVVDGAPEPTTGEEISLLGDKVQVIPNPPSMEEIIGSREFPTWQVITAMEYLEYDGKSLHDHLEEALKQLPTKESFFTRGTMKKPTLGRSDAIVLLLESAGIPNTVLDSIFTTVVEEYGVDT